MRRKLFGIAVAALSVWWSAAASSHWGELEITPFMLDRPEESFITNAWDRVIRWSFSNRSATQLAELIGACDLTAEQKGALLDTNRWQVTTNGWRILPPLEVVREMRPSAREKIYSVLGQSADSPHQQYPYFFRIDGFDEWLASAELPAESLALVRRLCYPKNQRLYFADTQVFELLRSSNETRRLVRALARIPTLMMKLKITPESDTDELLKYWGRLRKDAELEELLRSMARVPGGTGINISYFMPPVPRLRLYTYPDSEKLDCFWSSFNFFNDRPDSQTSTPEQYNQLLQANYRPVNGPRMFGDLLLLLEGEMAAHMCVYIAADIVYTKNGVDPKQPWVLMRMKDLLALYTSDKPQQWRVFRKNGV